MSLISLDYVDIGSYKIPCVVRKTAISFRQFGSPPSLLATLCDSSLKCLITYNCYLVVILNFRLAVHLWKSKSLYGGWLFVLKKNRGLNSGQLEGNMHRENLRGFICGPPNVCRPQQVLILFESSSERMFLYSFSSKIQRRFDQHGQTLLCIIENSDAGW